MRAWRLELDAGPRPIALERWFVDGVELRPPGHSYPNGREPVGGLREDHRIVIGGGERYALLPPDVTPDAGNTRVRVIHRDARGPLGRLLESGG